MGELDPKSALVHGALAEYGTQCERGPPSIDDDEGPQRIPPMPPMPPMPCCGMP
eukprot:CAMPEP_0185157346 /NCGR_PEP_ID=MMETSP1139-20130426/1706_1 /TAXON_ID=298111 /ORGANISM="Pavlova sp., Strain CCMP459" /LENGTH=53 /DNA_ID=CAMNT_0027722423 /DNA_START=565 /DNA_END=724 /DNA_ORIENTATION=+